MELAHVKWDKREKDRLTKSWQNESMKCDTYCDSMEVGRCVLRQTSVVERSRSHRLQHRDELIDMSEL